MSSFRIISSPLSATIQDLGRTNMAYYAIPRSGALDKLSFQRANQILGNSLNSPCIEFSFAPGKIEFESQAKICITGADMQFKLNDCLIELNAIVDIKTGDILSGSWPKVNARSYLAIKGKLDVPLFYSSYSSYPNANIGLNQGANLKKGDQIHWIEQATNLPLEKLKFKDPLFCESIKIKKGPEYHLFTKAITDQLSSRYFTLDSNSNRMGARVFEIIQGDDLPELKESVPVLPGFIQLTPSGRLIVILSDGHTTGGYPRIAYVPEDHLSAFNQIAPRSKFRFELD